MQKLLQFHSQNLKLLPPISESNCLTTQPPRSPKAIDKTWPLFGFIIIFHISSTYLLFFPPFQQDFRFSIDADIVVDMKCRRLSYWPGEKARVQGLTKKVKKICGSSTVSSKKQWI